MHNNYKNTTEELILANESLRELILNDYQFDDNTNRIINIELFFLAFSIFPDYLKKNRYK